MKLEVLKEELVNSIPSITLLRTAEIIAIKIGNELVELKNRNGKLFSESDLVEYSYSELHNPEFGAKVLIHQSYLSLRGREVIELYLKEKLQGNHSDEKVNLQILIEAEFVSILKGSSFYIIKSRGQSDGLALKKPDIVLDSEEMSNVFPDGYFRGKSVLLNVDK